MVGNGLLVVVLHEGLLTGKVGAYEGGKGLLRQMHKLLSEGERFDQQLGRMLQVVQGNAAAVFARDKYALKWHIQVSVRLVVVLWLRIVHGSVGVVQEIWHEDRRSDK